MIGGSPFQLREGLSDPARKQHLVDRLFATIADRYDFGNDLLSAGLHRRWKDRLVQLARIEPHHRVLDLACGTGDVTWRAALAAREGEVIGTDVNEEMLALAPDKRPPGVANVRFEVACATKLPYPDDSFDRVLCSYAGRGLPDLAAVAREAFRVLKPGGEFWNLDFARPPSKGVDRAWRGFLAGWGAIVGAAVHGDPKTYVYIPLSMGKYAGQRWFEAELARAGFLTETYETRLCLMAYNRGVKPEIS